jgi:predicted  nucleic acid-binding Zn-ribbon protein
MTEKANEEKAMQQKLHEKEHAKWNEEMDTALKRIAALEREIQRLVRDMSKQELVRICFLIE